MALYASHLARVFNDFGDLKCNQTLSEPFEFAFVGMRYGALRPPAPPGSPNTLKYIFIHFGEDRCQGFR